MLLAVSPCTEPPKNLLPPVEKSGWVLPATDGPAQPVWGIKGGVHVGLWPAPGPRGLIRIYTPYLGQPERQPLNFVAVEPIVDGRRGFSELEHSAWDNAQGKRAWQTAALDSSPEPGVPWLPQPPDISPDGQTMSFTLCFEPFNNGAQTMVGVLLDKRKPHEVVLRTFAAKDSAPMQQFILTATMGNYARLRKIHLEDKTLSAAMLWPKDERARNGFEPHREWGADALRRDGDSALLLAEPDEASPENAEYSAGTPPWWPYRGTRAAQFWKTRVCEKLVGRVNARRTYWATDSPIPGGVAFENMEFAAPFAQGMEFVFGTLH
jgi:hypothetical protein